MTLGGVPTFQFFLCSLFLPALHDVFTSITLEVKYTKPNCFLNSSKSQRFSLAPSSTFGKATTHLVCSSYETTSKSFVAPWLFKCWRSRSGAPCFFFLFLKGWGRMEECRTHFNTPVMAVGGRKNWTEKKAECLPKTSVVVFVLHWVCLL